jgi:phosphatidylinositol-3-phosphatase
MGLIAGTMALAPVARLHAAPQIGDVFYISMENEDLTEPGGTQILNNPAAPFENSLITPGNPNAADVSYASNYTNSGNGVHPSEPNYIWSEAGTNYNPGTDTAVLTDADPSAAAGNIFSNVPHLTGLMNAAGIPWKNYQEDFQISGLGPTVSSDGTLPAGQTNPYNGSDRYDYAAKHNPMVFFTDTAMENVYPLSQLSTDLNGNTVGRYNWITPDEYNDGHSELPGGFTYKGTKYLGDQAEIAQGDNFLSIVVPEIEASQAFKDNGVIVIWYDETEGGDTSQYTLPEIVISPLAKGDAYDSTVPMNHSSDLKTWQEVFGLGPSFLNNAIPSDEYSANGGPGTFNTVAGSNDLSDLFQPGVIPPGVPGNLTWNNAGGASPSDGMTWDIGVNNNWNNGSAATVYIDGSNVTFNDSNAGNYLVTLDTRVSPASVIVNNSSGNYTINGSGSIAGTGSLTKLGSGTLTLSTVNAYAGGTIVNAGALVVGANGALPDGSVNITGGTLQLGVSTGLAQITSLSVSGNGTFDVNNNHVIINYGAGRDPIASIAALLATGYAGGNWNGAGGIVSTAAAANAGYGLGYADSADPGNPANLASGTIEIAYTLLGDANLDGVVNGIDFGILAANFNKGVTGWDDGDFNYDNVVNGIDFGELAANFNKGASGASINEPAWDDPAILAFAAANGLLAYVPEPSSVALLAIGGVVVLRRKRRRPALSVTTICGGTPPLLPSPCTPGGGLGWGFLASAYHEGEGRTAKYGCPRKSSRKPGKSVGFPALSATSK